MDLLAYEGPDGELTLRPSFTAVAAFFDLGPDYWHGGSGSAYIGWIKLRDPGYSLLTERPILHIVVHEPYGVSLSYQVMSYQAGAANFALMTYNDMAADDLLVEHYIGGEPAYFPHRSFVSRDAAERVIARFLETQETPTEGAWRPRREVTYDGYGYRDQG